MNPSPEERAKALHKELLRSTMPVQLKLIAAAIREAVEAEREACADLVQNYRKEEPDMIALIGRQMKLADFIRSRSERQ